MLISILFCLFMSAGLLGWGKFLWKFLCKTLGEIPQGNAFIQTSIQWLLGYFFYEACVNILAITHLFYTPTLLLVGFGLSASGLYWLWSLKRPLLGDEGPPSSIVEKALLGAGLAFFFSWNLFPSFDVDSMSSYFIGLRSLFTHHHYIYDRFMDVRASMPLGDNLIYSYGLALQPDSLLFPQLMHGISKLMIIIGAYGAARSWGLGPWSLLAAFLVMSEEHLRISGVNMYIRINTQLTLAILLMVQGLAIFQLKKLWQGILLAWLAAFVAVSCKYFCLPFPALVLFFLALQLLVRQEGSQWKKLCQGQALAVLLLIPALACISYIKNWILTGSPVFPAALGPLLPHDLDAVAREIGRLWHYHLSILGALKTVSDFLTWPGILPLKLLNPLAIALGVLYLFSGLELSRWTKIGFAFFLISVCFVVYVEIFTVYEPRYYRFSLGVQVLGATFLIRALVQVAMSLLGKLLGRSLWWSSTETSNGPDWPVLCLAALFGLYAAKFSLGTPNNTKASPTQILQYLKGEFKETEIPRTWYIEASYYVDFLKESQVNQAGQGLGYLVTLNWPMYLYPLHGKGLGIVKEAAMDSQAYFDEGLFAQALLDASITHMFNFSALAGKYPLGQYVVSHTLKRCGNGNGKWDNSILRLDQDCLKKLAQTASPAAAQKQMAVTMEKLRSLPPYQPFTEPEYGKFQGF